MSKNSEKHNNSLHPDSNVNSQAKNNLNPTEKSCGCDEDFKNNLNPTEKSCGCDEDFKK